MYSYMKIIMLTSWMEPNLPKPYTPILRRHDRVSLSRPAPPPLEYK